MAVVLKGKRELKPAARRRHFIQYLFIMIFFFGAGGGGGGGGHRDIICHLIVSPKCHVNTKEMVVIIDHNINFTVFRTRRLILLRFLSIL